MTRIVVRRLDRGPDCSLCRDSVGDIDVACPGCDARYHGACLAELATRCATLGCDALRLGDRVATRAPQEDGVWFLLLFPLAIVIPVLMVFRPLALVVGLAVAAALVYQGLVVFARAITPPPRRRGG